MRCVKAVKSAQAAGLNVTAEAYPYGAASTAIGAAMFLDPQFRIPEEYSGEGHGCRRQKIPKPKPVLDIS